MNDNRMRSLVFAAVTSSDIFNIKKTAQHTEGYAGRRKGRHDTVPHHSGSLQDFCEQSVYLLSKLRRQIHRKSTVNDVSKPKVPKNMDLFSE